MKPNWLKYAVQTNYQNTHKQCQFSTNQLSVLLLPEKQMERLSRKRFSTVAIFFIGRSEGGATDAHFLHPVSKFFQFHAVFGEIWQKACVSRLVSPSQGNPGSATDFSITNFYHLHMRIGNVSSRDCLAVCLCVCVYICSGYNFLTSSHRNFIFGIQIHLYHIQVKLEYQGHLVKVKVI